MSQKLFISKSHDDILSVEYEYFSFGFDIIESFDKGFYVEYESFSFDRIITNVPFESRKSDFVKTENFISMTIDLDQTFEHAKFKGLVGFGPIVLPRPLISDDKIVRPMSHLLATFKYICLFDVWA